MILGVCLLGLWLLGVTWCWWFVFVVFIAVAYVVLIGWLAVFWVWAYGLLPTCGFVGGFGCAFGTCLVAEFRVWFVYWLFYVLMLVGCG